MTLQELLQELAAKEKQEVPPATEHATSGPKEEAKAAAAERKEAGAAGAAAGCGISGPVAQEPQAKPMEDAAGTTTTEASRRATSRLSKAERQSLEKRGFTFLSKKKRPEFIRQHMKELSDAHRNTVGARFRRWGYRWDVERQGWWIPPRKADADPSGR